MNTNRKYDCLALFSGGLDSLLAIKLIEEQGLSVLCAHFTTPFFGSSEKAKKWSGKFNIEIKTFDISEDFIKMLKEGPKHGYGKNLNPCKDCKILMLKKLKKLMPEFGAKFLITGEVLGQRPMSQTMNSLNLIEKQANVKGILLRPLSAKNLPETPAEKEVVNREKLLDIKGRSRTEQIALAQKYGIKEEDIPSPAGGCFLTDAGKVKRYKFILENFENTSKPDFEKANIGRHFVKNDYLLIVGREKKENESLKDMKGGGEILIEMVSPPGPISLLSNYKNKEIEKGILKESLSITSFFSIKAKERGISKLRIEREEFEARPKSPKDLGWKNLSE